MYALDFTHRRKDELCPQEATLVQGISWPDDHDLPVVEVALVFEASAETLDWACRRT